MSHLVNTAAPVDPPSQSQVLIQVPPLFKFARVAAYTGGIGAFATADIPLGTCVLCEVPIIIASTSTLSSRVAALSDSSRRQLFSLHDNWVSQPGGDKTAVGIFRSNGYPTDESQEEGGVFLKFSRFNSSCTPNVSHRWSSTAGVRFVFATRLIKSGEELLNCYISPIGSRSARQSALQSHFGFKCSCRCCSLSGVAQSESDARRLECCTLDEQIFNLIRTGKYRQSVEQVERLLEVLKNEGLDSPACLARSAFDAFQACKHGEDKEGMKKWIKFYLEQQLLCDVETSEDLREMTRIAESLGVILEHPR